VVLYVTMHCFTARRCASVVYVVAQCLSVCQSVCPSQVGVLSKRLNVASRKQRHTVEQGRWFSGGKDLEQIQN